MKVKTISHLPRNNIQERKGDLPIIKRNPDPSLHPFQREREYVRALNAVKLDRMFAKPFIAALDGHRDGVYCIGKHPTSIRHFVSGSADEIRVWNLSTLECSWKAQAHQGFVRGVCSVPRSSSFLSCSSDKTVKLWSTESSSELYASKGALFSVDHHRTMKTFVTSGPVVEVWDHDRAEPVQSFSWGVDTVHCVKFNQSESNIIASCASDRSITLYDIRTNTPLTRVILQLKSNSLCWNPMEPYNFAVANEDHNCYTFDMRRLDKATNVLKDHVSAVMDLDYSPTGQEIVSGSYDKTIRIFNARNGHSRDVYHTKRMQRNAINYANALKDKYKELPEIKKIANHRLVPTVIRKASKTKRIMLNSRARKTENALLHSKNKNNEALKRKEDRKSAVLSLEK
ncbi:hypothetical protein O9G_004348 [Rozella allomycis CSF55]|uniref:Sof1-like protein domain-containing protein n=1 Tax=Rozella allomycis (strain CSF55) TaxID=988480 RepID=A0A075B2F7_ROZAC|nr:hypothetical protein O9G_004348 [Rozella allomycis CSF55]|eukprot:EPZ34998.1 hypothetical protein O9G_004348 [Rozella allomycis CSF55]